MPEPCLAIEGLTKRFGGFYALNDLRMEVAHGHIHALIGPNGAGKTTFFNLVTGVLAADAGQSPSRAQSVDDARPSRRTLHGIARTFQNIRLFPHLTVLETVMIGEHCRSYPSMWKALASAVLQRPFGEAREEGRMRDNALELLAFFGLADKRDAKATDLPYGDQRRLEMARALATAAAAPAARRAGRRHEPARDARARRTDHAHRDRGITIVLVEHDMRLVMDISDRITVLNFGTKIADGVAGRDPAQPGRDRGLSRRGRAAMSMLSIAGLRAGYGKIEVLHDVALDVERGPDRHADRRERRRQDHAAEDRSRA